MQHPTCSWSDSVMLLHHTLRPIKYPTILSWSIVLHICIYVDIYMHIHRETHIHTYIHIHAHAHIHIHVYIYMHMYMHMQMHTYTHIHIITALRFTWFIYPHPSGLLHWHSDMCKTDLHKCKTKPDDEFNRTVMWNISPSSSSFFNYQHRNASYLLNAKSIRGFITYLICYFTIILLQGDMS